ncbi:hypothetical protein [Sinomicrobium pectinilyticum]|uniref:hypothetical protein n=1 Tax=Sinomicrobium pectinilyticum TaxID=1084421 RepID=UPI001472DA00|nr:hypothetical protein [Sinomicrobium pectinilyticum]
MCSGTSAELSGSLSPLTREQCIMMKSVVKKQVAFPADLFPGIFNVKSSPYITGD